MSGEVMPGFHENDGGMLGEDTATERFLSSHVAMSAVVVLWCFALFEATVSRRIERRLSERYQLFAMQPHEAQKHTALTLGMHLIFVPLSMLGLALVPFWALEIGSSPVVARAIVWIDATVLLLWEVRELFILDILANKALVAHHMSTCVIIIAILDFDVLRDITWLQLLFLAANTAWLQRPVSLFSRFLDNKQVLQHLKSLGIIGIGLDLVQLICAVWFFIACSVMGDIGAAIVVVGVAIPITYLRVQVNRWVWRFDPDFAIRRQGQKILALNQAAHSRMKTEDPTLHHSRSSYDKNPSQIENESDTHLNSDVIVHFADAEASRQGWLSILSKSNLEAQEIETTNKSPSPARTLGTTDMKEDDDDPYQAQSDEVDLEASYSPKIE